MRRAVFPPYSGQPPHGITGASHNRKEEQRQPGSERYGERADLYGVSGAHEASCAFSRCAAAGVNSRTMLLGAHNSALDVERAETPGGVTSPQHQAQAKM